jgi:hypothetical protein
MAVAATQTSLPREDLSAVHASFCQGHSDPKRLTYQADLHGQRSDSLGVVFEQE